MSAWEIANRHLESLVPYEPGKPVDDVARELGLDPKSVIKLASNEIPLGPSPAAREVMRSLIDHCHIYPDGGGYHLRTDLAERHQLEKNQIILGNGSNEIIEFLYHGFTSPGSCSVVASRYAFVVYKLMAHLFNVQFIEVPDLNFQHDLEAMRAAVRPDTRLVFVANPNNPTGTRLDNGELESFIDTLPRGCLCVLDEAYYEFLHDPPPTREWLKRFPHLVILRTFSKIQGLAALRIGYGCASSEITEVLQRCRQPFNANAMAQAAARASLADHQHCQNTLKTTAAGMERLETWCQTRDVPFIPSQANFLMVKTGRANEVFQNLLKRGVIIRSLTSYGLPDWIRISIGRPQEMDQLLQALDSELEHVVA